MDANQQRLIAERFEQSHEMRMEKATFEKRLITLEEENDDAQNVLRDTKALILETEILPTDIFTQPNAQQLVKARFEESHALKTKESVLEARLAALYDEFLDVIARLKVLTNSIAKIETLTAEMFTAPADPPRHGRGRPRRSNSNDNMADAPPQPRGVASTTKKAGRSLADAEDMVVGRPGLHPCNLDLPAPLNDDDRVKVPRNGGSHMLSAHHPAIVELDGHWAEVWCQMCGVNAAPTTKSFFRGMAGLHQHMRAHPSLNTGGKVTLGDVVEMCGRHFLSSDELEQVRAGRQQVRMVWSGVEHTVAGAAAKAEQTTSIARTREQISSGTGVDIEEAADEDLERLSEVAESRHEEDYSRHEDEEPQPEDQELQHDDKAYQLDGTEIKYENDAEPEDQNNHDPQLLHPMPLQQEDQRAPTHSPHSNNIATSSSLSSYLDMDNPDANPFSSSAMGIHKPNGIPRPKRIANATSQKRKRTTTEEPDKRNPSPAKKKRGPKLGSHNRGTITYQPQNTSQDVYYGLSVRTESFESVDESRKQSLVHVARMEETNDGENCSPSCSNCSDKGFVCRRYTDTMKELTSVQRCARCIYDGKSCHQYLRCD